MYADLTKCFFHVQIFLFETQANMLQTAIDVIQHLKG